MCDTESVIFAIPKVVPQKSGARTIDFTMNSGVIVWSMIFKRQILSVNSSFEQGYPGIF